jgi:hypothetical protein
MAESMPKTENVASCISLACVESRVATSSLPFAASGVEACGDDGCAGDGRGELAGAEAGADVGDAEPAVGLCEWKREMLGVKAEGEMQPVNMTAGVVSRRDYYGAVLLSGGYRGMVLGILSLRYVTSC